MCDGQKPEHLPLMGRRNNHMEMTPGINSTFCEQKTPRQSQKKQLLSQDEKSYN
ncbi:uncharacterized protein RAG0_09833 [Rhynchosporium agropyri]|uniref:Uncharacterized protein n=3 Tax=Rhynchosporium TaxID=38037 RepID=A0A1E1LXK4_RHYSE|nr:uncharacterized protein RCO7_14088 [Rhynchosporium commune]CZT02835.1 uncharacterized protein RAG0_09833 [Rhynchosporium agropyri]CZT41598.1 uncharacterized protein RSE6_01355 [Rhynchosporium secalis]